MHEHQWVEYTRSLEEVFRLEPGKLLWMKTKDSPRLDFGRGATVSLREPHEIDLPAQNWTDFALPYTFGVYVGDIVDATPGQADSLQFYQWVEGGDGVFVTQALYIASLPDSALTSPAAVLGGGSRDGYSVYNPLSTPVTLHVPPTSTPMSGYGAAGRSLGKRRRSDGWALRLEACAAQSRTLSTIVLGYAPSDGEPAMRWYPAAPSFGSVGVRVADRADGREYGHVVGSRLQRGGITFDLVFFNDGDRSCRVDYKLSGLEQLADTMGVYVVDPIGGGVQAANTSLSVQVPGKGRAYRSVSVGGPGYHLGTLTHVEPLARFAAYPNPFSGIVTIRFMLPEHVGRVECRLFDTRGRLVWQQTRTGDTRVGPNVVVWDGGADRAEAAAAGTYLLRVRAYDRDGALLAVREQRLIRMR